MNKREISFNKAKKPLQANQQHCWKTNTTRGKNSLLPQQLPQHLTTKLLRTREPENRAI
jgi:hypothetical protein